mmetsp:Transcript_9588/g.24423  ORF Transcript_9588/g.24423 Transcript_9588/m.24423 type:complete len:299 (-) Transcript_9588:229-1125(-)
MVLHLLGCLRCPVRGVVWSARENMPPLASPCHSMRRPARSAALLHRIAALLHRCRFLGGGQPVPHVVLILRAVQHLEHGVEVVLVHQARVQHGRGLHLVKRLCARRHQRLRLRRHEKVHLRRALYALQPLARVAQAQLGAQLLKLRLRDALAFPVGEDPVDDLLNLHHQLRHVPQLECVLGDLLAPLLEVAEGEAILAVRPAVHLAPGELRHRVLRVRAQHAEARVAHLQQHRPAGFHEQVVLHRGGHQQQQLALPPWRRPNRARRQPPRRRAPLCRHAARTTHDCLPSSIARGPLLL